MNRRLKASASLFANVALTLLGLSVITFLIGRVMPVDPILAAVGDNASHEVVGAHAG